MYLVFIEPSKKKLFFPLIAVILGLNSRPHKQHIKYANRETEKKVTFQPLANFFKKKMVDILFGNFNFISFIRHSSVT